VLLTVTVTELFILSPNWEIESASPKIVSLFASVRIQTGIEMFSVGDEKYWSTAAASILLAACSMLAVWQERKPTHTRAHARAFNGPLSGTARVSQYQKG